MQQKMNLAQAKEILKQLPHSEFASVSTAPWSKYPAALVRDELVRRLKLQENISPQTRAIKYQEIISFFRMKSNHDAFEELNLIVTELDSLDFKVVDYSSKVNELNEDGLKTDLQLEKLLLQNEDLFEGKTKPGDWRPNKTELCPVCHGNGQGNDSRMCSKCVGRGFISL
jgi:hypothetical protein